VTKKLKHLFATTNDTQILHKLVGFKDIRVINYYRDGPIPTLGIEQIVDKPICPACGQRAQVKERPVTHIVDLPAFGTPIQLAWKKHRLTCGNTACDKTTWTLGDHRIAAKQCRMTTRAAKWVTEQVGRGRPISDVARELHCDWHTIANTVTFYGEALLEADHKRLNHTTAIGLDETSFTRHLGQTSYITTIADVENHQLIDILPTRKTKDVAEYLLFQPQAWKRRIKYGALDMSNLYSAVYNLVLPKAAQVVDPFHVVSLGNRVLDEVRRRVQTEQTGHRGRRNDPLYRARRVLLKGQEKLSEPAEQRRKTLLALGDPNGEAAFAYLVKERRCFGFFRGGGYFTTIEFRVSQLGLPA
jgi:transposase